MPLTSTNVGDLTGLRARWPRHALVFRAAGGGVRRRRMTRPLELLINPQFDACRILGTMRRSRLAELRRWSPGAFTSSVIVAGEQSSASPISRWVRCSSSIAAT
jgi:hypothetical protein